MLVYVLVLIRHDLQCFVCVFTLYVFVSIYYIYIYCPPCSSEVNVVLFFLVLYLTPLFFCMTYNVPCLIFLNMFCIVLYAYCIHILVCTYMLKPTWIFFTFFSSFLSFFLKKREFASEIALLNLKINRYLFCSKKEETCITTLWYLYCNRWYEQRTSITSMDYKWLFGAQNFRLYTFTTDQWTRSALHDRSSLKGAALVWISDRTQTRDVHCEILAFVCFHTRRTELPLLIFISHLLYMK